MSNVSEVFAKIYADGLARQGRNPDRIDYSAEPLIPKDGNFYPLHQGQKKAWAADTRHLAIVSGTRAGKTSLGPFWCLREIQRCGGGSGLIVGPTYPLMDRNLVPECQRAWKGLGEYKYGRRCFEFSPEGLRKLGVPEATVYFGFAEDPEGLESMRARWCWRDETGQTKFTRAAAEAIDRRLAQDQGRILDTTTPYEFNWFKTDIWDKRLDADPKELHVESYRSIDNPSFPIEEWERQKAILPEWKFALMYEGRFTRPAGAVYDCFDRKVHFVPYQEPCEVVRGVRVPWKRFAGVDFGPIHTWATKLAEHPHEVDEEGYPVLYAYQEYFPNKACPTFQHVKAVREGEPTWPIRAIGGARSEKDWRWEWTAAGLPVEEPWITDVMTQIDRVYAAFRRNGLKIMDSCPKLADQIEAYSWEIDDGGEPIPGKLMNKASFHGPDSLRYPVSQLRPNKISEGTITRGLYFGEARRGGEDDPESWAK